MCSYYANISQAASSLVLNATYTPVAILSYESAVCS